MARTTRRIRRPALLLTSMLVVASACNDTTGPPAPLEQLPRQLTVQEREIISASNDFAFRLLREVVSHGGTGENVFISPYSVSMALGMTLNGAAGGTYEAMRETLGFGGLEQTRINESYRDLTSLLLALDERTELRIANSVWARAGHPFRESFFSAVRDYFGATARELDFGAPDAVDVINGWVSDATNGRIEDIVRKITPQHLMFLINAVYFKGQWTNQFDPARTRPSAFQVGAGDGVEVETMHADVRAGLFDTGGGVVGGELPYGNQAFTMVLALPPADGSVDDLVEELDATTWEGWMEAVAYIDDVAVALPRWEMEYEARLDTALIDMGMDVAFSGAADFTRLTPSGGYIGEVRHKTFLKVDEEGTEAAAATSVSIEQSLGPHLFVDRPFLVAIRERFSGAILFIGLVRDPR